MFKFPQALLRVVPSHSTPLYRFLHRPSLVFPGHQWLSDVTGGCLYFAHLLPWTNPALTTHDAFPARHRGVFDGTVQRPTHPRVSAPRRRMRETVRRPEEGRIWRFAEKIQTGRLGLRTVGTRQVHQSWTTAALPLTLTAPTGSPFSIEYGVNSVPPRPCKYVYFKLFINGRHMASWTVDPAVQRSGRLDKSFWAPSGVYSEAVGLEARHFVFLPGQENKSIAEDGGLIEVQVFRAKNRWRKAPKVEEFRGRE
jgi:hypothetical protein